MVILITDRSNQTRYLKLLCNGTQNQFSLSRTHCEKNRFKISNMSENLTLNYFFFRKVNFVRFTNLNILQSSP